MKEAVTEADIQNSLWLYLAWRNHSLIVPNVYMFAGWESDLVSVTTSDYIWEFEIKISMADFKRDLKKYKHRLMKYTANGASRFYYVVNGFDLDLGLLPPYAGLMKVDPLRGDINYILEIKKAPFRKAVGKITQKQTASLARKLSTRYWQLRFKE